MSEAQEQDDHWMSDALQAGDVETIKQRVQADPSFVHHCDYIGETPLQSAIGVSNLSLVNFLLKHEADPNVPVDDGYTCLLTAIDTESVSPADTDIVESLIAAGADIHETGTNGWTPLHMAAARGNVPAAQLLIAAGAHVNRRTEIDASETPLMEAAYAGQPETVQLLLDNGADASMEDSMNDRTALETARVAAAGPDPEVYEMLKEENMQIDFDELFSDMPAEQLDVLKESMQDFDAAETYIQTSSNLVKNGNHAEVIRILSDLVRRQG